MYAGAHQGGGVREDVARRVDVTVLRGIRRTESRAGTEQRVHGVDLVGLAPAHVETDPLLHRDPSLRVHDFLLGEARHEVALLHEARVDAEQVSLTAVELARVDAQANRDLGASLSTHHPGGAGAGALAEG